MYQLNTRVVANGTPLAARHTNIAKELRRGGLDPVLSGYTDIANDPSLAYGELDPLLHYFGDSLPGLRSLNTHPGGSSGHLASSWIAWLEELGYSLPEAMVSGLGPEHPYGTGSFAAVGQEGAVLGGEPDPARTLGDRSANGRDGGDQHATDAHGVPVAAFCE